MYETTIACQLWKIKYCLLPVNCPECFFLFINLCIPFLLCCSFCVCEGNCVMRHEVWQGMFDKRKEIKGTTMDNYLVTFLRKVNTITCMYFQLFWVILVDCTIVQGENRGNLLQCFYKEGGRGGTTFRPWCQSESQSALSLSICPWIVRELYLASRVALWDTGHNFGVNIRRRT